MALDHVVREEAAAAQLGDALRQCADAGGEAVLSLAITAVRSAAAQLVGLGVHYGVHDLLGESAKQFLLSMAPSTKRGVANMSDLGSDKIFTEVFFVKRALGRHPYTNIFDAISYSCSNVLIRGGN